MPSRRSFLLLCGGAAVATAAGLTQWRNFSAIPPAMASGKETFAITHSDAQWHQLLTDQQYYILREAGTERPYSSPLNDEHHQGTFICAGCQLPLFSSSTKFNSHTGWPSFWQPLDGAVGVRSDRSFGMVRDEVHCHRCGGHLGHVFDDGPRPTGLRYCMNGLAMKFTPTSA